MRMLSTDEVARRLGVKRATVYAYVSRGLLTGLRNGKGKETLFKEDDVRAFEATRQRTSDNGGSPVVHTGITFISDGKLYYRGHDVDLLARADSFENIVDLLWTGEITDIAFPRDHRLHLLAKAVTAPLPASARLTDRLRVIVAAAGAADHLRFDTTPTAVIGTGRKLLDTMATGLPQLGEPVNFSLGALLWSRLTASPANGDDYRALEAALVLLADHDLAASTFAVRVAASTRANPYAVVGAGLAAMDGPLHGGASGLAVEMLSTVLRGGDLLRTISDRLRTGAGVPGFGHPLYPDGDPRAVTLLKLIPRTVVSDTADDIAAVIRDRAGVRPNIDLALAVLTLTYGMPQDAGETIFAIARTAGWIAHAMEEYADQPSRFRPIGRYAGLPPLTEGA
ncbi:citrate synthase family protein [Catenuloplanes atrovinosus]|uniref:citrate synthase (unknown stereospecificity) n=1 Tax=Catenuloplanes atrovinosus TaxID=137266 RepID=A0AAE4C9E5_9ACTN|nr:citrate synthase family protein [Catenuloplanes atrovinosus]MDR7275983.1 citrate synthase [Catenuloplanes atrovinosus]